MKFDNAGKVEEIVWQMRLADLPRGENRAILNRTYNGSPPFDEATAEENNVEINRNDLEGPNLLAQGRRQWSNAFLKPGNYFNVTLDSGPHHKRSEWGHYITLYLNRLLKRRRNMMEQIRATGANTLLHGIGPVNWKDRRSPIPVPLPVSSLMVPSETDIDFENCEYFAVFREYTPAQLYEMTHGPKVDPGWNLKLVDAQMKYVGEQIQKQPNATAYQYMPERIEELIKQDMGFWGSDAVPTVDIWDFYFRQAEDGKGWYRRVILDWGAAETGEIAAAQMPKSRNKIDQQGEATFLYTSGERKYANSISEILHCQFGDCSAVAPFKYHSVRSLGWMLWGICDLQNRLHCKFNEAVFLSLMWFFRVASNEQLTRLRTANFGHMGVIPQGIEFIKAQDRFTPDMGLVNLAFARNRQLMAENSASFTQDFDKGDTGKEMTATETMARVNSVNALVSGMLTLAYTYEEFKYREIARRFCLKNSPDVDVREFRKLCLAAGVPPEMLDVDRWEITAERVLGAGNKTLEMAQVQFLQQMRQSLNPDAQRKVDHIAIESSTDDPALAEELAPLAGEPKLSNSSHTAQMATERLLKGLPYKPPQDAVYEDYVIVWLSDLNSLIQKYSNPAFAPDMETIAGLVNIATATGSLLELMAQDEKQVPKVKEYQSALEQLKKTLLKLGQQVQQREQAKMQAQSQAGVEAGNGAAEAAAETKAELQGKMLMDKVKAQSASTAHAQRTAQRQVAFELEQQRADRKTAAEIRREGQRAAQELAVNQITAVQDAESK